MQMVFNNLAGAGIYNIVFNHGNLGGGAGGASVREQYSKLGVNPFPRSREMVEALIPPDWRVARFQSQAEVPQNDPSSGGIWPKRRTSPMCIRC